VLQTDYYYHWVDTSAGGLLVQDGIMLPVVSASALTWFMEFSTTVKMNALISTFHFLLHNYTAYLSNVLKLS
jgi:hypothetical protein